MHTTWVYGMHWWEHVGRSQLALRAEAKECHFSGPFFDLKFAFLDLSLQPQG